jgi:hypothetical protein
VLGHGAIVRSGTVVMTWVAGAFSVHGVVVAGVGEAPLPCLLGEGRPEPPSPLDAVRNSLAESSIKARREDGVPLRVEPMKMTRELPLLGERLRPLK